MPVEPDDDLALRALAYAYARAMDRRDVDLLLTAFTPDARLALFDPADGPDPVMERVGHDALAAMVGRIARYDRTYHFVGNAVYDVDGDDATGEVHGIAHHLTRDGDGVGTDRVMLIRYDDRYHRGDDGWRIVERRVLVDWTETRTVDAV